MHSTLDMCNDGVSEISGKNLQKLVNTIVLEETEEKLKTIIFKSQESHQDRPQGLKRQNIEHSRI